jgi:ribosomal-protein-alanine N-acetyltransferase
MMPSSTFDERKKPVLKTPRLLLRRLTSDDSAFMVELMNEPPYIDNIGDRGVRTVADAMRYIEEKYQASYARHGFGLYLVELPETAEPMGICGLVKRDSLDRPDLGFAFLQRFWSRGYATEAAAAILGHAREQLGQPHLYGLVSARNARSIRLLEHLGFAFIRSSASPGQAVESSLYGVDLASPKPLERRP